MGRGVPKTVVEQLGARPPEGDHGPMLLTSEHDMKIAFDMVDHAGDGALARGNSRQFLRAMGYCIPDEELDAMLDVHGPSRGTSRGGTQLNRTKWSFNMLKLVVMENRGRDNSSVDALAGSLK